MRRSGIPILIAGAFAGAGLLVLGLAFSRFGGRETVQTEADFPADTVSSASNLDQYVRVGPENLDALTADITDSIAFQTAKIGIVDGDAIAEDAGTIIRAWLGGSAEDYIAYLDQAGHRPPPAAVWQDPETSRAAWESSIQELRNASFDPTRIDMKASFERGLPAKMGEPTKSVTGWRMDKLSGFDTAAPPGDQIAASGTDVFEIRIPMRAMGIRQNSEYLGSLGMSYSKDPATESWTLVAVSVYDLPQDDIARVPPF